jgi:competence protein ComEA
MQLRTAAFFAAAVTAAAFTAPANGQSQKPPAAPAPASVPRVNVNVATAAQIALLPRIGSTVAARVVDYRKAHGPFQRVEDLMEVK